MSAIYLIIYCAQARARRLENEYIIWSLVRYSKMASYNAALPPDLSDDTVVLLVTELFPFEKVVANGSYFAVNRECIA